MEAGIYGSKKCMQSNRYVPPHPPLALTLAGGLRYSLDQDVRMHVRHQGSGPTAPSLKGLVVRYFR